MIPKICYRYARKITWREIKKSYTVLENAAILIFVLSSVVYLGNVMSSVYRFLVLFPVSIKQRALKYGFYFRLFNRSLNTGAKILYSLILHLAAVSNLYKKSDQTPP